MAHNNRPEGNHVPNLKFNRPVPFTEAVQKLGSRTVVARSLSSAEWARQAVEIRETSFFVSNVESALFVSKAKRLIDDFLNASREDTPGGPALKVGGRAAFVKQMQDFMDANGIPRQGARGTIQDIGGSRRLNLIFDTQTRSANAYGAWKQGNDPEVLAVFPAQRFIREAQVKQPRPRHSANQGEVRRKDDIEFWVYMNGSDIGGFEVPWGPWGFNSGMGVEDVLRSEAESLGLVGRGEIIKPPRLPFDNSPTASVKKLDPETKRRLIEATRGILDPEGTRLTKPNPAGTVFENPGLAPKRIANDRPPTPGELRERTALASMPDDQMRDHFKALPEKLRQMEGLPSASYASPGGSIGFDRLANRINDSREFASGIEFRRQFGQWVQTNPAFRPSAVRTAFDAERAVGIAVKPDWFRQWAGESPRIRPSIAVLEASGVSGTLDAARFIDTLAATSQTLDPSTGYGFTPLRLRRLDVRVSDSFALAFSALTDPVDSRRQAFVSVFPALAAEVQRVIDEIEQ